MSSAAALLTVLGVAQRFDPRTSLFGHFEPGFDYDFSDTTTLFQDTDGSVPVTGVEQTVALILDKSRGLVQSQFSTNDNFASGATGWSAQSGWSVGTGSASVNSSAGTTLLRTSATSVAGRAYIISFVVSSYTSGLFRAVAGTAFAGTASAAGTYTFIVFSNGGAGAGIWADSTNTVGTITSLSVRELPGLHQIQSTAASRAVLRSRYNLLTYSEQFDNAAWNKSACAIAANSIAAPDGTTTADTLTASAGLNFHYVTRTGPSSGTGQFVHSFYVKKNTATWIFFTVNDSFINYFNLDTGLFGTTPDTCTVVAEANGWYRISVVRTLSAANLNCGIGIAGSNGGANFTAAGTESIYIWGADLRAGNDTIYPYQRINDATDYSTGPQFPTYLEYDGVDDSYASAANLDLTGTDKVTVFAAVTKLSDAAVGMIASFGGTASGTWELLGARSAGGSQPYSFAHRTNVAVEAVPASNVGNAPDTAVLTGISNIGAPVVELRRNGISVASNSGALTASNYGNFTLALGRRIGDTPIFRGRMYRVIGRGAATPVATISQCERFLARQTGITL